MKILKTLSVVTLLLGAVSACDASDSNDSLTGRRNSPAYPGQTAGDDKNTFDHAHESIGGENGITDIAGRQREELAIGSPDDVARLHGAQKLSYAALGRILADFGVDLTAPAGGGGGGKNAAAPPLTAGSLYVNGKNALGAPVYSSRTPEMTAPSTSALAKEYDVFIAAAPSIIANIGASKRCPGVVLVDAGQMTEDGISCLIGKPATPAHVTLANKLIADAGDATKGTQIAVATILAAAHISE